MKKIKLTSWVLTEEGTGVKADASTDGKSLKVSIRKNKYTSTIFECAGKGVRAEYNYRIGAEIICKDCDYRIIAGFKNSEGEEITRQYVEPGKSFSSPEGAASVIVVVVIWGKKGEFILNELSLEELEEHKTKKIVAATVGIKYNRTVRTPEWNMAETLKTIDRLCEKNNPDIIVLTELFYDRWTGGKIPLELDSEPVKIISEKAKECNTFICFSIRLKRGEKLTNTGVLINRKGEIEALYDKSHITMGERISGVEPGNDFKVIDTELGKVAIVICWDMFFPEYISALRAQGVELICHPTAGFAERRIGERAYEAGAYIITSGVDRLCESAIFNPLGEKLTDATENDGYAVCELEIGRKFPTFWLSWPCDTFSDNIFENERRKDLY